MVFSSLIFLFAFLPAVLTCYYIVPKRFVRARNMVLLLFSLFFYFYGEPKLIVMLVLSCVLSVIALVQKFTGRALGGFTTVILVLLFASSIIMISLGIIGYYIARIYEEIKGRPRYIISQTCGKRERGAYEGRE